MYIMLKSTLLCRNEHISYAGIISRPQSIRNILKYIASYVIGKFLEMINEVLDSSDVNVAGQFTLR